MSRIRAVLHSANFEKETLDSLADQFRKGFTKQRIADCLRFRDICRLHNLSESTIKITMEDLNQLQHYSFCKSHALSYAQLVWALAYEKAYSPHTFWLATLNHCNSEYRSWVHWREARNSGLLLSRGSPPYKLIDTKQDPKLVSTKGEQLVLLKDNEPSQQLRDMKERGYWLSESFFPVCYKRIESFPQRTLKVKKNILLGTDNPEYKVSFRGLIATGRIVRSETEGEESSSYSHTVTFLCIGVDNGKFLDLVIHGAKGYLLGYAAVEGYGKTSRPNSDESLEVQSIKGVSLQSIVKQL